MGDLLGSPLLSDTFQLNRKIDFFDFFADFRVVHVSLIVQHLTGAIIPALMHRIPSELRSQEGLGESSPRMSDLLRSPRVAFLFWVDLRVSFTIDAFVVSFSTERRVINRVTLDMCDHTSTNAPDPIRTPQRSVLGRE
ncbi:hypothetical protein CR513_37020, partial [Mucuna pruriens]